MAQLSDDCFAFGGALMGLDEARALLARRVVPVAETERVPLAAAVGRVLAEHLVSPIDVPPHDNSAVDGYAVAFADLTPGARTVLPLAGRLAAGQVAEGEGARGTAVRIFTGAPMPPGFDTVMMQEDCREADGCVAIPPGIRRGANRRKAGEDVSAGMAVLRAGRRLRPEDVGLAASIGASTLPVRRRLRVGIFSTGDEVTEPGQPLTPGAIYDANRFVVAALVQRLGGVVTDYGILRDRPDAIAPALASAAAGNDLLITSGGVSTGEEDHVKAAVESRGSLHAWRLAIKPGRPVALGQVGGTPFIGLPGNPVAVMVTFLWLARPLFLLLSGAEMTEPRRYRVAAGFEYRKKQGRREFVRARLVPGPDGALLAEKYPHDGAGILSSMAWADGLVELGEEVRTLPAGSPVDFVPFTEFG